MYHFVAEEAAESIVFPVPPTSHSLFNKFHVPAHISQYLKNFQVDAIHFLYTHYVSREFCILNDESGLGKSATVAVFLGAVGKHKKSLIIVQNNEEIIAGWRFHFDVLTKLSTTVIDVCKDSSTSPHNIYIAKWSTLRSIPDISLYNFDIVIVDNRGQMLNNNFCTSMLIKNFEKKVNIVISSVDVTSNLKLLHNILRLSGGGLEAQYQDFTKFEAKFKLPDSKEVTNKKCSLEEYFLKREILCNYCKDFRLRRYCHQYDHQLPLIDSDRYKINLDLWLTTNAITSNTYSNGHRTTENINNTNLSSDKGTEELFEQELVNLSKKFTEQNKGGRENKVVDQDNHLEHNTFDIIDICDEPVIMSPLLFVSESEEDEERNLYVEDTEDVEEVVIVEKTTENNNNTDVFEFVELSSESIDEGEIIQNLSYTSLRKTTKDNEAQCKIKSVKNTVKKCRKFVITSESTDGGENVQNVSYTSLKKTANDISSAESKKRSEKNNIKGCIKMSNISSDEHISVRLSNIKANHNSAEDKTKSQSKTVRSPSKENVASTSKKMDKRRNVDNNKKETVTACRKPVESKEESNKRATRSSSVNNKEKKCSKSEDKKSNKTKNVSNTKKKVQENEKNKNMNENIRPATRSRNKGDSKAKTLVKEKNAQPKINCNLLKQNKTKRKINEYENDIETPKRQLRTSVKRAVEEKKNISLRQQHVTPSLKTAIKQKREKRQIIRKMAIIPMGIHSKETRGMQRVTRSSKISKYVRTDLALNIDKKPVKSKQNNRQIAVKTTVNDRLSKEVGKGNSEIDEAVDEKANLNSTKKLNLKAKRATKEKSTKDNRNEKKLLTKSSQISVISREYEDIECGQKLLHDSDNSDKPVNEFLVPPTPLIPYINTRNSQCPAMFSSLSSSSYLVESSDVAFVPNAKTTKTQDQIIVLNSSQDECSSSSAQSSQSRRTRALKQGKSTKSYFAATCSINKRATNTMQPAFGELLARQTKSKSPDLFSACSDAGITCTQANNNQASFDGFKIFGSEVKQFQQQHAFSASKRIASAKSITRERSCLDILEKMFEPKTGNSKKSSNCHTTAPAKKTSATAKPQILPSLPKEVKTAQTQQQLVDREKNLSNRKETIVDDVIFEITNNDTFGSVMRINSNGDISPVQQQQQLKATQISQHNKITNYLIGSTQTQIPSGEDEQQVNGTPSKRPQLSGATAGVRKSPKSKTTQSTKLTKWFLRNTATMAVEGRKTSTTASEDTTTKGNNGMKISRKITSVKRRRLDLKNVQ